MHHHPTTTGAYNTSLSLPFDDGDGERKRVGLEREEQEAPARPTLGICLRLPSKTITMKALSPVYKVSEGVYLRVRGGLWPHLTSTSLDGAMGLTLGQVTFW